MDQNMIIAVIAAVVVVLLGVWYYLSHAKTRVKAVKKSGVDTALLCQCLGGKENIEAVEANGSKVVFTLKQTKTLDAAGLKSLGASGVVISKNRLTAIFGKASDALAKEMAALLQ